jgi:hypothetical protein
LIAPRAVARAIRQSLSAIRTLPIRLGAFLGCDINLATVRFTTQEQFSRYAIGTSRLPAHRAEAMSNTSTDAERRNMGRLSINGQN